MHDRPSAAMPGSEQDAAMTALVFDVLEAGDEIGDASEAEAEADDGGPGTRGHG